MAPSGTLGRFVYPCLKKYAGNDAEELLSRVVELPKVVIFLDRDQGKLREKKTALLRSTCRVLLEKRRTTTGRPNTARPRRRVKEKGPPPSSEPARGSGTANQLGPFAAGSPLSSSYESDNPAISDIGPVSPTGTDGLPALSDELSDVDSHLDPAEATMLNHPVTLSLNNYTLANLPDEQQDTLIRIYDSNGFFNTRSGSVKSDTFRQEVADPMLLWAAFPPEDFDVSIYLNNNGKLEKLPSWHAHLREHPDDNLLIRAIVEYRDSDIGSLLPSCTPEGLKIALTVACRLQAPSVAALLLTALGPRAAEWFASDEGQWLMWLLDVSEDSDAVISPSDDEDDQSRAAFQLYFTRFASILGVRIQTTSLFDSAADPCIDAAGPGGSAATVDTAATATTTAATTTTTSTDTHQDVPVSEKLADQRAGEKLFALSRPELGVERLQSHTMQALHLFHADQAVSPRLPASKSKPSVASRLTLDYLDLLSDELMGKRGAVFDALRARMLQSDPLWMLGQAAEPTADRFRKHKKQPTHLAAASTPTATAAGAPTALSFYRASAVAGTDVFEDRATGRMVVSSDETEQNVTAHSEVLRLWSRDQKPLRWALAQASLAGAMRDRVLGSRAENLEAAVAGYQQALEVLTKDAHPLRWAKVQANLGTTLLTRTVGSPEDNVEAALGAFHKALEVYTPADCPEEWARTQIGLARAFQNRRAGVTADNLEAALLAYDHALEAIDREARKEDWAATLVCKASVLRSRIAGTRADNIELALQLCEQALSVFDRKRFCVEWALLRFRMAELHTERVRGSRHSNCAVALAAFREALNEVQSDACPAEWAAAQVSLARLLLEVSTGSRASNVEEAIAALGTALRVYERAAYPLEWADVHVCLAEAYQCRVSGAHKANMGDALKMLRQATSVLTKTEHPERFAQAQLARAQLLRKMVSGDRQLNLEASIQACDQALEACPRASHPDQWAATQLAVGVLWRDQSRGSRRNNLENALEAHRQALAVYTRDSHPEQWGTAQASLALTLVARLAGSRAENVEQALDACDRALSVFTPETHPERSGDVLATKATAYQARVLGSRAANLNLAEDCCRQGLAAICDASAHPDLFFRLQYAQFCIATAKHELSGDAPADGAGASNGALGTCLVQQPMDLVRQNDELKTKMCTVLHEFKCPISHEIMQDPVVAEDGHTYERSSIETWFAKQHTSPLTREKLSSTTLLPNRSLRAAIESFLEQARQYTCDA